MQGNIAIVPTTTKWQLRTEVIESTSEMSGSKNICFTTLDKHQR